MDLLDLKTSSSLPGPKKSLWPGSRGGRGVPPLISTCVYIYIYTQYIYIHYSNRIGRSEFDLYSKHTSAIHWNWQHPSTTISAKSILWINCWAATTRRAWIWCFQGDQWWGCVHGIDRNLGKSHPHIQQKPCGFWGWRSICQVFTVFTKVPRLLTHPIATLEWDLQKQLGL